MSAQRPHYFLFSQTQPNESQSGGSESSGGLWRFLLAAVDGCTRFEVSDREPEMTGDRLDMLAVLRGLEALDQPSRVTLHTSSRYVFRGFRFGLPAWRLNNWCWEKFGVMEPVSNRDLWQRIDGALQFHQVHCHRWQPKPATRQDIWLAPVPDQTFVEGADMVEAEFETNRTPEGYEPYEGYSSGQAFGQASGQRGQANASQMAEWAGMFQPRQRRAAVA
jgi:ribonuclease HI